MSTYLCTSLFTFLHACPNSSIYTHLHACLDVCRMSSRSRLSHFYTCGYLRVYTHVHAHVHAIPMSTNVSVHMSIHMSIHISTHLFTPVDTLLHACPYAGLGVAVSAGNTDTLICKSIRMSTPMYSIGGYMHTRHRYDCVVTLTCLYTNACPYTCPARLYAPRSMSSTPACMFPIISPRVSSPIPW